MSWALAALAAPTSTRQAAAAEVDRVAADADIDGGARLFDDPSDRGSQRAELLVGSGPDGNGHTLGGHRGLIDNSLDLFVAREDRPLSRTELPGPHRCRERLNWNRCSDVEVLESADG